MLQVVRQAFAGTAASVRELILQGESRAAFHETEERRDVAQLTQGFQIDESQCEPVPQGIIVLDDVLTTGAHFVAAKTVLQRRFGAGLAVIGIFIARRVFPASAPAPA